MIYLHYKDTKTFGHSFSFLLIFKTLRASYLQVGNFSKSYYYFSNIIFIKSVRYNKFRNVILPNKFFLLVNVFAYIFKSDYISLFYSKFFLYVLFY